MSNRMIIPRPAKPGNSFGEKRPEILDEWHPTKNGTLTAFDVSYTSDYYAWWKCSVMGHEWESCVSARSRGKGCPYCKKRKLSFENSVAYKFPDLCNEWHPKKNGTITPADVFPCGRNEIWWICSNGHEWKTSISSRTRGSRCPYCAGRKVAPERNLQTTHPDLAKEWHPDKNYPLGPNDVSFGSGRQIWWLCKQGHDWHATPAKRSSGSGCPYCVGKLTGQENSLLALYPSLADLWHSTRNVMIDPSRITPKSSVIVWWKCDKSHEWESSVKKQLRRMGCPYCPGFRMTEESSFGTCFPERAKEWHPDKNGELTAFSVLPGSNKRVWWICSSGHEWQATVIKRQKNRCPYCIGKLITPERSLANRAPEIAKQWHPSKNDNLTANDVSFGVTRKFWWLCQCGYEWNTIIRNRIRSSKCPACRTLPGQTCSPNNINEPTIKMAENRKIIDLSTMIDRDEQNQDLQDDLITCLICGIQFPSLHWHLVATHQMNVDAYRQRFNLPNDYPLRIPLR